MNFCSWKTIKGLSARQGLFIMRLKMNIKEKFLVRFLVYFSILSVEEKSFVEISERRIV
jgi:hypothetical protein